MIFPATVPVCCLSGRPKRGSKEERVERSLLTTRVRSVPPSLPESCTQQTEAVHESPSRKLRDADWLGQRGQEEYGWRPNLLF